MDNTNYILFSSSNKMADMILKNYTLLSVLPRFDIKLGFGDKSVQEICKQNNIDLDFFLLICNTHTFADYLPTKNQISKDLTSSISMNNINMFGGRMNNQNIGSQENMKISRNFSLNGTQIMDLALMPEPTLRTISKY